MHAPTNNNAATDATVTAFRTLVNESIPAYPTFADRARILTARGIPVVPVNPGEKRCQLPSWPALATTDQAQIEAWATQNPNYNTAAVGKPDGFVILDSDSEDLAERIKRDTGKDLPATFTVKSGGRGFPHSYFRQTERTRALGNRNTKDRGFDWQSVNKYVVGPGSQLAGGGEYAIINDAPIAACPDWLADWVEKNSGTEKRAGGDGPALHEEFDFYAFLEHYGIAGDQDGDWFITEVCPIAGHKHEQSNRTGFYYDGERLGFHCFAGNCQGNGMSIGQVIAHLNKPDGSRLKKPYPGPIWSELNDPVRKAESPRAFVYTEGGNAERLVCEHKDSFRYLLDDQVWLAWDGRRWKRDATAEIHAEAKATVRHMRHLAADIDNEDERKRFAAWAHTSDRRAARENMVALARYEPEVKALREDFDRRPWLLNVLNGTIDLQTGRLRPHDRADMLTQLTPIVYDPAAKCPRWLQFLDETFPDPEAKGIKQDVIDYLQRAIGYTLTGDATEHCFWLLLGSGRNGKGVFLNTTKALLGEYAAETSFDTFSSRKQDAAINPRDGLAALAGKRFVKASESEQERRFSEARIKALTGGDTVRTAKMYADDFEYKPEFKIWLASNHEPIVTGLDDGIWSRIHRINFEHQVPLEQRDTALEAKLVADLPGILNWALAGLRVYRVNGLQIPVAIKSAVSHYRHEQNPLREFLTERYDRTGDPKDETTASALAKEYNEWTRGRRVRQMTPAGVGMALRNLQVPSRQLAGRSVYCGLRAKQHGATIGQQIGQFDAW